MIKKNFITNISRFFMSLELMLSGCEKFANFFDSNPVQQSAFGPTADGA